MPRTIVYAAPKGTKDAPVPDDFFERLAKYIPGEVLALFIPLVTLASGHNELVGYSVLAGVAATLMYTFIRALLEPDRLKKPRPFFYAFAVIAFLVWAVGTSGDVQTLVGWDAVTSRWSLAVVALLLPALDQLIDLLVPRRKV
jgi:hypothetical protein